VAWDFDVSKILDTLGGKRYIQLPYVMTFIAEVVQLLNSYETMFMNRPA
jgi:hypothetical protein